MKDQKDYNNKRNFQSAISAGHLTYECFNTLRTNPLQEVIVDVGSTSSETSDDDLLLRRGSNRDRQKQESRKGTIF